MNYLLNFAFQLIPILALAVFGCGGKKKKDKDKDKVKDGCSPSTPSIQRSTSKSSEVQQPADVNKNSPSKPETKKEEESPEKKDGPNDKDKKEDESRDSGENNKKDGEKKDGNNPETKKEELKPKLIKRDAKEERIAQNKEVRNKADYPTFNDVESDWDSAKDKNKKDATNMEKGSKLDKRSNMEKGSKLDKT